MMTSKKRSSIRFAALAALLSFGALIQACGSDSDSGTSTAGAAGKPVGAAGSGVSGGGSGSAGAPVVSAGAPGAGAPATSGGAGGAAAGAGTGGGAGGASAGAGTGGSSAGMGAGGASQTFAAVKALFGTSCGVGDCHNAKSGNLDYQGTTDLHGMLTTVIPATIKHCKGSTPAVSMDQNSLLVKAVKANTSCVEGTGMGNIGRMPDNCKTNGGTPACLTDAQVKVITDWVAAGVPK